MIVAVIISVLLSIIGINLINFITTPAYIKGSLSLPLLTFSIIFAQGQQIVSMGISLSKKTWHYSCLVSVAVALNIGLNFYFIPKWRFVDAGITTVISYMTYLGCYFVSQKYLKVDFNLVRTLIYTIITLIIAFLVPYAELKTKLHINIFYKILLIGIILILPLFIGLIHWSNVKNIKELAVNSFEKFVKK